MPFAYPMLLLVCGADKTASIKTIVNNGSALEAVRETELGPARRYWIDLEP